MEYWKTVNYKMMEEKILSSAIKNMQLEMDNCLKELSERLYREMFYNMTVGFIKTEPSPPPVLSMSLEDGVKI